LPQRRIGGVQVELYPFLTSATDADEWSVARLGRFTPWVTTPSTHWVIFDYNKD